MLPIKTNKNTAAAAANIPTSTIISELQQLISDIHINVPRTNIALEEYLQQPHVRVIDLDAWCYSNQIPTLWQYTLSLYNTAERRFSSGLLESLLHNYKFNAQQLSIGADNNGSLLIELYLSKKNISLKLFRTILEQMYANPTRNKISESTFKNLDRRSEQNVFIFALLEIYNNDNDKLIKSTSDVTYDMLNEKFKELEQRKLTRGILMQYLLTNQYINTSFPELRKQQKEQEQNPRIKKKNEQPTSSSTSNSSTINVTNSVVNIYNREPFFRFHNTSNQMPQQPQAASQYTMGNMPSYPNNTDHQALFNFANSGNQMPQQSQDASQYTIGNMHSYPINTEHQALFNFANSGNQMPQQSQDASQYTMGNMNSYPINAHYQPLFNFSTIGNHVPQQTQDASQYTMGNMNSYPINAHYQPLFNFSTIGNHVPQQTQGTIQYIMVAMPTYPNNAHYQPIFNFSSIGNHMQQQLQAASQHTMGPVPCDQNNFINQTAYNNNYQPYPMNNSFLPQPPSFYATATSSQNEMFLDELADDSFWFDPEVTTTNNSATNNSEPLKPINVDELAEDSFWLAPEVTTTNNSATNNSAPLFKPINVDELAEDSFWIAPEVTTTNNSAPLFKPINVDASSSNKNSFAEEEQEEELSSRSRQSSRKEPHVNNRKKSSIKPISPPHANTNQALLPQFARTYTRTPLDMHKRGPENLPSFEVEYEEFKNTYNISDNSIERNIYNIRKKYDKGFKQSGLSELIQLCYNSDSSNRHTYVINLIMNAYTYVVHLKLKRRNHKTHTNELLDIIYEAEAYNNANEKNRYLTIVLQGLKTKIENIKEIHKPNLRTPQNVESSSSESELVQEEIQNISSTENTFNHLRKKLARLEASEHNEKNIEQMISLLKSKIDIVRLLLKLQKESNRFATKFACDDKEIIKLAKKTGITWVGSEEERQKTVKMAGNLKAIASNLESELKKLDPDLLVLRKAKSNSKRSSLPPEDMQEKLSTLLISYTEKYNAIMHSANTQEVSAYGAISSALYLPQYHSWNACSQQERDNYETEFNKDYIRVTEEEPPKVNSVEQAKRGRFTL